jgi:cysteinyl-tRNA synthetase
MLRLSDTRSQRADQIDPARRGQLRVFSCGPPAARYAHLGDLRTALLADLIRRAAHRHRLSVLVCEGSNDVGQAADWQLYADAFRADCSAINIRPPDYAPRASESIGLITDMIAGLISAGHAYATADGSVYFGAGGQPDWVLWRGGRGAGELSWAAPWGQGSPGSDIACSAMSLHYLGDVIDIHTGAVESRFAHYATERAQSDAAAGHEVVRHWVHGELARFAPVSPGGEVLLADLGQRGIDPLALRLAFLERRYRERLELTWPGLAEADRTLGRWREQVADWATHPSRPMSAPHVAQIASAFDDDLNAPAALAVLRDLARAADVPAGAKFETFAHVDQLLGLDLVREVGR